MTYLSRLVLALAVFGWSGGCLAGADDTVSQSRTLDLRVARVKLEGLVDLKLRQGPAATLVISGDQALMARSSTQVEGDTITIATEGSVMRLSRRQLLRAELTLPQLREVASDSVGTAEIHGFSGDELDLKLDGAGAMQVHCAYRLVNAVLGGVGSMEIHGTMAEGIDLNLRGAGVLRLRGSGKWLRASLSGLGNLDARHFPVDSAQLDLSGLGNATVWARQHVRLDLSGMGSVTVHGKPVARSVNVNGLGSVNWK
ncbi:DUF2807 domain-containing protein [Massilia sp. PAMC28688]|uniref:GIN domain-containing protein n=1 Tax=Massilia sp. PAMC28688 TaxID=2861283 RepID=UPI001C63832E|nr:DUF2807 domain-containing protein [Massilia sp. PAMC28688]QYF92384.1 DUF2807 domain-containing protein [Massilia sp. PAMC28688]